MDLHLALKNIVETDGEDILVESRLVNILSDFQAYDSIPASKYILRAIISEGYSKQLLSIGQWNTTCSALIDKVVKETGFQLEYVDLIFQSLAYGLGWKTSIEKAMNANATVGTTVLTTVTTNPNKVAKMWSKMTKEEKEAHILSLLDWKISLHEVKAKSGLDFQNFSVEINSSELFYINYEISGKITNSMNIQYVLYDKKGKIKDKGYFCLAYSGNYNGFLVRHVGITHKISDISRILLYEEK